MTGLLAAVAGLTAVVAAAEPAPPARAPQIQGLLVVEALRPKQAPEPGGTVWDLVEGAAHKARKARTIVADGRAYTAGTERPAAEWDNAEARLAALEAAYRTAVYPGVLALRQAFLQSRVLAVDLDVVQQSREFYASQDAKRAAALGIGPSPDTLKALYFTRERSEAASAEAVELLEKGVERLAAPKPPGAPVISYLDDIVAEAEAAVSEAARKALALAKDHDAMIAKGGAWWNALEASKAYGGEQGDGQYREEDRARAVRLANEAKAAFVVQEYTLAARVEETRTLDYLLERFGKL